MRKVAIVLTILAFFACLILGITISKSASLPSIVWKPKATGTAEAPAVSLNQQNILLVFVEQLETDQPKLLSAWGVFVYVREPSSLMFVPLYPGEEKDLRSKLDHAFHLTSERALDPDFLKAVEQAINVRFDHYILVDSTGIQQADRWISSIEGKDTSLEGGEKGLLRAICRYITSPDRDQKEKLEWKDLFPDHASTDLPFQQAMTTWEIIAAQGQTVRCEVFDSR